MDNTEIQAYKEEERRKELYRDIAKAAIAIWGRENGREELDFYVKQLFQADVTVDDLDLDTLGWLKTTLERKVPDEKRILLEDFF